MSATHSAPQKTPEIHFTVASLQTVHLTTCWCSLPSKLISDWHTRQFITGTPLASGLAMAVYGGGSSAARDKEISAEKTEDPKTLPASIVSSRHRLKKEKKPLHLKPSL